MYTKKPHLTIFIVFLTCLLLLATPVVAKNTCDYGHERHRIKFNLQIVDTFTGHPLNGVIRLYAIFNDQLWKESLDMGEWRELLTLNFRGGQAIFEAPLHGRYSLEIELEEGVSEPPYGLLPHYEEASRLAINACFLSSPPSLSFRTLITLRLPPLWIRCSSYITADATNSSIPRPSASTKIAMQSVLFTWGVGGCGRRFGAPGRSSCSGLGPS